MEAFGEYSGKQSIWFCHQTKLKGFFLFTLTKQFWSPKLNHASKRNLISRRKVLFHWPHHEYASTSLQKWEKREARTSTTGDKQSKTFAGVTFLLNHCGVLILGTPAWVLLEGKFETVILQFTHKAICIWQYHMSEEFFQSKFIKSSTLLHHLGISEKTSQSHFDGLAMPLLVLTHRTVCTLSDIEVPRGFWN